MKLSMYNLSTSKTVDINNPKNYHPGSASKGFSYRPRTSNLTLLTRTSGKDIISIHEKGTLEVVRSWWPDTIDAQGFYWTSDGNRLLVMESAAYGHRICIYTADGHLFKTWEGPKPLSKDDIHLSLGPGLKLVEWSRDGTLAAIADHSERVVILSGRTFTETVSLLHKTSVKPADTLQVGLIASTASDSSTNTIRSGRNKSPFRPAAVLENLSKHHSRFAHLSSNYPQQRSKTQRQAQVSCHLTILAPSWLHARKNSQPRSGSGTSILARFGQS